MTLEVGTTVRIAKSHWARARQTGVIEALLPSGRLVVRFAVQGVGFDDGWKLELGQEDLEAI